MLPYTIRFENKPEATAPAHIIRITDRLDEDLDLATFELTEINFADQTIIVPEGLNHYQASVEFRIDNEFVSDGEVLVQVDAALDIESRELSLTMIGLDPETGWLPEEILLGILYPEDQSGRGNGYISYLVRPAAGLPSGTEITNKASIVFDWNDPIETPLVLNTIDVGMPTSSVLPLPSTVQETQYAVTWAGQDDEGGSGVRDFTIYVSANDGPYEVWLEDTTDTEATFSGENNTTYAFYSVARDNVYQVEAAPLTPDAVTLVRTNQPPHASAGGPYTIVEGGSLTLDASGSSDPDDDPLDFTWDVNGNGVFGDAVGKTPTLTWQQLGDLGIIDNGSWTVTVLVDDRNGGTDAAATSLDVTNASPTIELTGPPNVGEGSLYTLTLGVVVDPGDDTVSQYIVHWGDGDTDTYISSGEVTHTYADGLATQTITVDLTDEDGTHTDAGSLTVSVENVRPTITAWTNTAAECGDTLAEQQVHVTADFSDPGFDNLSTVEDFVSSTIDWGDGVIQTVPDITVIESPGSASVLTTGTVSGTHAYATGGVYTITITVRDDDGGAAAISTEAFVTGVGLNNGVLQVVGSPGRDHVDITLGSDRGSRRSRDRSLVNVDAKFTQLGSDGGSDSGSDGGSDGGADLHIKRSWNASDVQNIQIVLCGGNDHADIDKKVTVPASMDGGPGKDHLQAGCGSTTMFGGPGNDKLQGGDAADILYGGPGNDDLQGKKGDDRLFGEDGNDDLKGDDGNDILVGSNGKDKLQGGKGDDLVIGGHDTDDLKGDKGSDVLIAGFTIYDNTLGALDAVFAKWLSRPDYDGRVAAVTTDTGSIWDNPSLAAGVTVFEDQSKDKLRGGKDRDLFFADLDGRHRDDDLIKDLKKKKDEELVIDLAELLAARVRGAR